MAERMLARKIPFLGLSFDALTIDEILAAIDLFVAEQRPRKIFCPNVSLLIDARRNAELRRIYESCDLLPIDGMGIYYASRFLPPAFPESCSAVLVALRLLERSKIKGYRFFFLGTKADLLESAVRNVRERYAGAQVVGWHHGFFSGDEEADVVRKIARARADILLLGMSSPKKELFVHRHLSAMGVPVSLGVGGTIDILAGEYSLAPELVRKLAVEWLYRLVQEPRRLWKRYLTTNCQFAYLVVREVARRMSVR